MTAPHRATWRAVVRLATPLIWEHRRTVAAFYALRVAAIALALVAPWPLKIIIDHVLSTHAPPRWLRAALHPLSPEQIVFVMGGAIVAIAVLRAFAEARHAVLSARFRERLNVDLRDRMLAHLQLLPPTIRTTHRTGELVLRLVGDVDQFVRFQAKTLPTIVEHVVTSAATIVMMFWIEPRLALFSIAMLPGLVILMRYYGTRLGAASRAKRRREGEVAGFAQEVVRGLPIVQALGGDRPVRERFRGLNAQSLAAGVAETCIAADMERTLRITHGMATAIMVAAGARLVLQGSLTLGALTVLASYLTQLLKPIERLNDLAETTSKGLAGGERLIALLEQQPAVRDAPNAIHLARARGVVELRDVWFAYGGSRRRDPVLRGVNLRLEPGQLAVLVGASGAGKSTLLSLLVRLFDPTAGTITLDDCPLPSIALRSLRQQIAIMTQETHLFAGSVRTALGSTGARVDDDRAWEALSFVAMDEFVRGLPRGLDAMLGEDGVNMSGGQRQRLSLARAFLLDRPVLLLDEPTSNVDSASEAVIAAALERIRVGRACLAITHRPSLFDHADVMYRLEEGRIVPAGALHIVSRRDQGLR